MLEKFALRLSTKRVATAFPLRRAHAICRELGAPGFGDIGVEVHVRLRPTAVRVTE